MKIRVLLVMARLCVLIWKNRKHRTQRFFKEKQGHYLVWPSNNDGDAEHLRQKADSPITLISLP
jgi:hypothetical protein